MNSTKHIWDGAVGIQIKPKKTVDGTYFWSFRFKRAYKRETDSTFHYADSFTMKNTLALGKVMSEAIQFMNTTKPEAYLKEVFEQEAA